MAEIYDYAIPGQSLTKTPGSAPFERPPQFTEMGPALDFIFERLIRPESLAKIEVLLKGPVTVVELTKSVLWLGIQQNKWSVDLSFLLFQTVAAQIEAVAKRLGVKDYKFKREDTDYTDFLRDYASYLEAPSKEEQKTENALETTVFKGIA
ncbi:MAG: hypothetical protein EBR82_48225 [Caulobacteraceae bacterium]|nr:hypothetical protein [Caulobacteraceae bacterium]